MAKVLNFGSQAEIPVNNDNKYINANVSLAVKFYQSKKLPPGVKFRRSSMQAQSQKIPRGLIEIFWSPKGLAKCLWKPYPTQCRVIETTYPPHEFEGRLIRAYEEIEEWANRYNDKIRADNEKGESNPYIPKKKARSPFKTLSGRCLSEGAMLNPTQRRG